ncbi:DNA alkylation repair protein [Marivirga sp. S37H4]|uniref:DNA alkylation repair protein n=1 Tax=Marivirga aurantiaca TaxID=2802615 RepID=A0A934X097_9BACT|nr:DNA alkylation repair protein [Marivirga aurantiaca]MBK6266132.1 DNA alkylation repair protein [Marivirga aurantiaca]
MKEFILTFENELKKHSNVQIALEQKAYLRNQFEFYGLKTTDRRAIQKPFLIRAYLPEKKELHKLVKILWKRPQREYHYFAQELAFKYINQLEKDDIKLFEWMVLHKSWWDTVDFIANKLMGAYFKVYPEQKQEYVQKWLQSNNIWLQRSALLFQLKYKQEVDTSLLSTIINKLSGSKEFFINKAIGWVLREYSQTNPDWVTEFVNKTALNALSKKEALRLMK